MSVKLSWPEVTVQQFQDIHKLSLETELDEMDRLERAICIMFDKTSEQVDEMSMTEFTELSKAVAFLLNEPIPGKPVRRIKVGKTRYGIIYNPTKLKHRQYVELLHFGDKPIENMHFIMASIVNPITWYGKELPNSADDHEIIAGDMLNAPVIHVYHTCVFFCELYLSLIDSIKDSLVKEIMETKKGMSKETAEGLVKVSRDAMAGFIPQAR